MYSASFLDHLDRPRNVGSWPIDDPDVATGRAEASECRDTVKVQLRVSPVDRLVTDARFKAFGCSGTIALSSLATERVKGLSLDEVLQVNGADLGRELSLDDDRRHCEVLIEEALRAAVRTFRER
jgi:nitrogen fixation NifU-like protein